MSYKLEQASAVITWLKCEPESVLSTVIQQRATGLCCFERALNVPSIIGIRQCTRAIVDVEATEAALGAGRPPPPRPKRCPSQGVAKGIDHRSGYIPQRFLSNGDTTGSINRLKLLT